MDVTCPRCQTDYEFDDALVSERGTTVKCTNCGHQFRVFRPRASSGAGATPEIWRIERKEGEPLELRSLVELQRAIRAGRVSRVDLLRRGDGPPRRVGDIPELEPFFPAPRPEGAPNTLPLPTAADGPVQRVAVDAPKIDPRTPAYGGKTPSVPPPPRTAKHGSIPPAPRLPTPVGLGATSEPPRRPPPTPAPPPPRTPPPPAREVEHDPPTVRRTDAARTNAPATGPSQRPEPPARGSPSVPPQQESYDSLFPAAIPKRRAPVGAIVAVLVVGGVAAAAATVGRPYLARLVGGAPQPSATVAGDRMAVELSAGDRARADGDFAGAREAYLRATVIDDKSLAAWDGLCTAESELAMAHFVAALAGHSALERDQAASVGRSAGKSCTRWGELARGTAEGAKLVAADLRPMRAIAAQGDAAGVRVYLPSHPGNPIAEALAWLADATKGDAGSANAVKQASASLARADVSALTAPSDLALVAFGAASSGATARRDEALAALAKRAPRHVLLDALRGLGGTTTADAGVADAQADAQADAKPDAAKGATVAAATTGGGGDDTPAGDYRSLNEKGHKALAQGEVAKAETYFKAALAQHPGDVDALYGLGQIARSRGDHAAAISYFKQVLDASAGFAPARLALADEQWATGDKAAAIKNYELYLERVTEGSGAERARARIGKTAPEPKKTPEGEP